MEGYKYNPFHQMEIRALLLKYDCWALSNYLTIFIQGNGESIKFKNFFDLTPSDFGLNIIDEVNFSNSS